MKQTNKAKKKQPNKQRNKTTKETNNQQGANQTGSIFLFLVFQTGDFFCCERCSNAAVFRRLEAHRSSVWFASK